ncbi:DUF4153 domain-containing protein, partial [Sphingomonas sp. HMWF008]
LYTFPYAEPAAWRIALATGIGTAAGALGFGMERNRWWWAVLFAGVVGTLAGLIFYWNGGGWRAWGDWHTASLFLGIAIAVPLFQTARDEGAWRFPYAEVHGHAWTNVVLWVACWLFVGVVFALAWLLAALFDLIGLHFLRDLLRHNWFNALLFGGGFGAALGLLRERDTVVRLLQRVVTAVLSVLAPVLGVGLLIFLVSLPFTGLNALWDATRSTTPILLSCVIGALILANAVIGNGADEEATNPVLRYGAMALAVAIFPLAVVAANATGLRIGQYGLTPDRLWALVFVALASAYGLVYLLAVVRGRGRWATLVRPGNIRLAFGVVVIALVLATPILSFNALSTADQVARLESGKIALDKFDWAALAFDFGDPGKAALKRLAGSKNATVAVRARDVGKSENRWEVASIEESSRAVDTLKTHLRVLPEAVPVPRALLAKLSDWDVCGDDVREACTVFYTVAATEAVAIRQSCYAANAGPGRTTRLPACAAHLRLSGKAWTTDAPEHPLDEPARIRVEQDLKAGKLEVRPVTRRQLFIGDRPVGEAFE